MRKILLSFLILVLLASLLEGKALMSEPNNESQKFEDNPVFEQNEDDYQKEK
jgi:uncharacterized membrane protein affecting hemolysin expression